MDWRPFAGLVRPGYDISVVWNYCDTDSFDWSWAVKYDEICLVAWSLGVAAASSGLTAPIDRLITMRLAVNGTPCPVDDSLGIPRIIFEGTRDSLDQNNLLKFYRRVAGSRAAYDAFSSDLPQRALQELAEELELFISGGMKTTLCRWDRAVVSDSDAIFPPANQKAAWADVPTDIIVGAHLPDFQAVLDRYIIDKDLTESRFHAGGKTYDSASTVQKAVVDRLLEMADLSHCANTGTIIEVGSGTGYLSHKLDSFFVDADIEMWDLAGTSPVDGPRRSFRRGDAEILVREAADESADMVLSSSTIQWFNSPRRFLEHCSRILRPDGRLIISTFVDGNLEEIRKYTGRSLPLMTERQWLQSVPENMAVEVSETEEIRLEFGSPSDVFRHLKATGVNSLGRGGERKSLRRIMDSMEAAGNGVHTVTYRPIYLILSKK